MKTPWFPFYSSDYISGTRFFTVQEHGYYIILLTYQHDIDGPIPISDVEALTGKLYDQLPKRVRDKFHRIGDRIYNERLADEIDATQERLKKASNRGKKGAAARWAKNECTSNAQASIKQWQPQPQPQPQSQTTTSLQKIGVEILDQIQKSIAEADGNLEWWQSLERTHGVDLTRREKIFDHFRDHVAQMRDHPGWQNQADAERHLVFWLGNPSVKQRLPRLYKMRF